MAWMTRAAAKFFFSSLLLSLLSDSISAADWVRGRFGTNEFVFGAKGGLLFAIAPSGFRTPEPRGLIRLGYPVLTNDGYDLVNFIAVEPVVNGKKGYSELEKSKLDGVSGKRFWIVSREADETALKVRIGVERF